MTIYEEAPPGPTFADVLNGVTFGPRPAGDPAPVSKPTPKPRGDSPAQPVLVEMPEDDPAIVRPYAWTSGRTQSENEIRVEAMISTRPELDDTVLANVEHCSIARLCRSPKSVAEISAELEIPLQVAKIVLGDMVETGLVVVHRTTGLSGGSSHLDLMERVLGGLRRL